MEVKFNDLMNIYEKEIKINTKNRKKVYMFDKFKMENIVEIYDKLITDSYKKMKYNIFLIRNPKYRVVMSLNISDKIINHYITRFILMPKLEKYLDIRNVATRKDMGRDYGIKLVKKYIEKFKYRNNCYVLKLDISKYFYNIDHNVLKKLIKNDLTKEEYKLISMIIESTNCSYINNTINKLKDNELKYIEKRRQEVRDIPLYRYNKGLPIGNMSSQFLSIFYLHQLDHMIIHDYHLKYYVRYMDDILIFSDDREYLKEVLNKIVIILKNNYLLDVNKKKTFIVNIKDGFNFCGYRFRIINNKTVINISSDTLKRVKDRVKEVKYQYELGIITFKQAFSSINTYYNGFKYGSRLKVRRIIDTYFFG